MVTLFIQYLWKGYLCQVGFSVQGLTLMNASPFWEAFTDRYAGKLMAEQSIFRETVMLLLMAFVQSAEQLVA